MLSVENHRRIAVIAWRLADYMHTHAGALPEDLSVLGEMPTDAQNALPFGYEHGRLDVPIDSNGNMATRQGFVLYSHGWDGNLPVWNKAPATIVILFH